MLAFVHRTKCPCKSHSTPLTTIHETRALHARSHARSHAVNVNAGSELLQAVGSAVPGFLIEGQTASQSDLPGVAEEGAEEEMTPTPNFVP